MAKIAIMIAVSIVIGATTALALAAGPAPARRAALIDLLRQDCGACHGMTLKGGLGPSLLPDALAGKETAALIDTVLDGRPGTPMPPWRPFLTPAEVSWLIENLKRGIDEKGTDSGD